MNHESNFFIKCRINRNYCYVISYMKISSILYISEIMFFTLFFKIMNNTTSCSLCRMFTNVFLIIPICCSEFYRFKVQLCQFSRRFKYLPNNQNTRLLMDLLNYYEIDITCNAPTRIFTNVIGQYNKLQSYIYLRII